MIAHRARRRRAPRSAASSCACCCVGQCERISGGWAMCEIRSVISPCASVIAATSRSLPVASASADVEAHVGLAVGRRSRRAGRRAARRARRARRASRARPASPASAATPSSTARRASQASRQPASSSRGRRGRPAAAGRRRTCRRRARAPRSRWPLCDQRGQRLAQRRARDAQLRAELALGGQARSGLEQPELDRRSEPVDGLLERRLRAHRREDAVQRRDRRPAHRRSKPRTRSQSVTAASKAVELDARVVEVVVDDLLAERLARHRAAGEQVAGVAQRARHARLVRRCRRCRRTPARARAPRRRRAGRAAISARARGTG